MPRALARLERDAAATKIAFPGRALLRGAISCLVGVGRDARGTFPLRVPPFSFPDARAKYAPSLLFSPRPHQSRAGASRLDK